MNTQVGTDCFTLILPSPLTTQSHIQVSGLETGVSRQQDHPLIHPPCSAAIDYVDYFLSLLYLGFITSMASRSLPAELVDQICATVSGEFVGRD